MTKSLSWEAVMGVVGNWEHSFKNSLFSLGGVFSVADTVVLEVVRESPAPGRDKSNLARIKFVFCVSAAFGIYNKRIAILFMYFMRALTKH